MLVVMQNHATQDQIDRVVKTIEEMGYAARPMPGETRIAIGLVGNDGRVDSSRVEALPGVAEIIHVSKPYKQVSREWRDENTLVTIAPGVTFGGSDVQIIAGPCSVESREQMMTAAHAVKKAGANMIRGGAYKPRTSPYDFQGLGQEALHILDEVRRETGLPVVTEVMSTEDVDTICEHVDMLQIGARNMQNYALLRRLAKVNKPLLLKRGPSATVKEWLLAAEYLLSGGNPNVVLCERGIKTFETETRNTIDLAGIALAKELSHLPVIADPSHGTGRPSLIPPVSRAALALGADGLIVEVHPCPERAYSDGPQSLYPDQFARLVTELRAIGAAIGRSVAAGTHATAGV